MTYLVVSSWTTDYTTMHLSRCIDYQSVDLRKTMLLVFPCTILSTESYNFQQIPNFLIKFEMSKYVAYLYRISINVTPRLLAYICFQLSCSICLTKLQKSYKICDFQSSSSPYRPNMTAAITTAPRLYVKVYRILNPAIPPGIFRTGIVDFRPYGDAIPQSVNVPCMNKPCRDS